MGTYNIESNGEKSLDGVWTCGSLKNKGKVLPYKSSLFFYSPFFVLVFHLRLLFSIRSVYVIAIYKSTFIYFLLTTFPRPAVNFPAKECHRPSTRTKLYCLVTAYRCEQLAQGCYVALSLWASNSRPNDRKFNALPLSQCATWVQWRIQRSPGAMPLQAHVR